LAPFNNKKCFTKLQVVKKVTKNNKKWNFFFKKQLGIPHKEPSIAPGFLWSNSLEPATLRL
jgi:hypothetical protein